MEQIEATEPEFAADLMLRNPRTLAEDATVAELREADRPRPRRRQRRDDRSAGRPSTAPPEVRYGGWSCSTRPGLLGLLGLLCLDPSLTRFCGA